MCIATHYDSGSVVAVQWANDGIDVSSAKCWHVFYPMYGCLQGLGAGSVRS